MTTRHTLALATLVALFAAPLSAQAQSSTGELTDTHYSHRVAGDLGFYFREQSTAEVGVFQPSFYGNFELADLDGLYIQLDVAWRFVGLFGDVSAFRALNPYVGVRFGAEEDTGDGSRWRARGGVGLTAPLTNAYDDFRSLSDGSFAHVFGAAMQGFYDPWLEAPLTMALVGRGDFEYRHPYFVVGGDGAITALFPVEYEGRTGDTAVAMQLGVFAGGRPIPELVLGARFQAVATVSTADLPPGRSNTEGYTSLIPFVRGEIGSGFVEGRLLMNLDEGFGWAFDSTSILHVWALYVVGGGTF